MSTDMSIAAATGAPATLPVATAVNVAPPSLPHKAAPMATPSPAPKIDPTQMMRELQEATQKINDELKRNNRELNFSIDKVLDYPVVTVKNSVTGEVVRQIPNETTIRIAHNLTELKGLLLNKSA